MKTPRLLDGVQVSDADRDELMPQLGNWKLLHEFMTSIRNTKTEEDRLKKLIILEIDGNGRLDILGRLKGRLNRVRNKRESKEILK